MTFKKIVTGSIIALALANAVFAVDLPAPSGFVNDFAGILKDTEKTQIENFLQDFRTKTGSEIAVVIIKTLDGQAIEDYSIKLARQWGIGEKNRNNGVLFLVSIEDRAMRIEVGRGLEGAITDLGSRYIQDEIARPLFRANDYYNGIMDVVVKLAEMAQGEFSAPANYQPSNQISGGMVRLILIMSFVLLSWLGSILGRSKCWWPGGIIGAGAGGITSWIMGLGLISTAGFAIGLGVIGLLFDFIVSRNYQNAKKAGRPTAWWAGGLFGGGSRSSGGSFGGFSGGGFSGGGSSSGW
ncbi:MAG: TPM domain-containing protein [Patescibacteria group bacterium]|nr:TPM domain-containing protein [Patescibacteria group bacterium]